MNQDTGHEVDLGGALSARITEACTDGCLMNWWWLLPIDILLDLAIPLGLQSLQLLDPFPRELHDFMPDLALSSQIDVVVLVVVLAPVVVVVLVVVVVVVVVLLVVVVLVIVSSSGSEIQWSEWD